MGTLESCLWPLERIWGGGSIRAKVLKSEDLAFTQWGATIPLMRDTESAVTIGDSGAAESHGLSSEVGSWEVNAWALLVDAMAQGVSLASSGPAQTEPAFPGVLATWSRNLWTKGGL